MFVDAFLLAVVLVVWVVYILFRSFGRRSKTDTNGNRPTQGPEGSSDVFLGGTARKDRGELVMTGSMESRKMDQYGFVEFKTPLPEQFTFRFELLIEEPDLGVPLHAFIWLSLGGDPDKESAVSSNAIEDGGTRVFLLKTDAFGQRETLEVFRTIAGIARLSPDKGSSWDLVERVQYMPKNQWVLATITGDLRSRTFRMTLDDAQFSFVVPMHFNGPFRGQTRAYLGAKTLKGTGIRVRNLGVAV